MWGGVKLPLNEEEKAGAFEAFGQAVQAYVSEEFEAIWQCFERLLLILNNKDVNLPDSCREDVETIEQIMGNWY